MRREFFIGVWVVLALNILSYFFAPVFLWNLVVTGPLIVLGLLDAAQETQTIRRNFPLLGRIRYLFEMIRPEIQQYFIETNTDGAPFSREQRSVIYQRAKKTLDTLPFGTQRNVYEPGYEWINHSMMPTSLKHQDLRVTVGGPHCKKPYSASIFNVSAMSYGAISSRAILALNGAAKDGGFAQNTGEGGLSPYHLEPGGDVIWQFGTGYFGCRTDDGKFSESHFKEKAAHPNVKMIEIKISQGAKPGHGGILPGKKVTPEIAKIRNVPMGKDVISPPGHSAFKTPMELMQFIAKLRDLSGGKPIGMKVCLGKHREFIAVCKAMIESGITPDFITVDGGEGGTGAAPVEFSNHVGTPLFDGLIYVHNALTGFGLRDKIKIIAASKVSTGFDIIKRIAIGADLVYSARAMMIALGCIQALRCNSNHCPTGVATQDPKLVQGLVVSDKRKRVATYHHETIASVRELLGAMGLKDQMELRPWHIHRRVDVTTVRHYGELYEYISKGALLGSNIHPAFARAYHAADPYTFGHSEGPASLKTATAS